MCFERSVTREVSYPNPGGSTITLRLHNTGLLQGEAEVLKIIDIMGRTPLPTCVPAHAACLHRRACAAAIG